MSDHSGSYFNSGLLELEGVPKPTKPGVQTSEFWLAVLSIVSASILLALGSIDATVWAAVTGVSSGGYGVSRGLAKR